MSQICPKSEEDGALIAEAITVDGTQEREVEQKELAEQVQWALDKLTPRERFVIVGRFFENETLEEVALAMNVTRERVRQIEIKAMRKLMHPKIAGRLSLFLDQLTYSQTLYRERRIHGP